MSLGAAIHPFLTLFTVRPDEDPDPKTAVPRTTRALMRTMLGFEFISKLGYNPRGAARNLMQRLLDFVEMGAGANKKSKEVIDRIAGIDEEFFETELKKVGLKYDEGAPQLIEAGVGRGAAFQKQLEYNPDTNKVHKHRLVKFVSRAAVEKQTQTGETDTNDGYGHMRQPRTSETTQEVNRRAENAQEPSVRSRSTHSGGPGAVMRPNGHNQTQQSVSWINRPGPC